MSYLLLRVADGWIINNSMEIFMWKTLVSICGINYVKYLFCLYILEQKCRMWVPNNLIAFNQNNEAYFKNQENDNNIKKLIKIIDISYEFKDTNVSAVENSDESSVQFEETSSVNAIENFDENSVQFEGTNNVIEIKKLLSTKTKDKKSTWSVAETRALIGAVEACYEDMHHVHKRKNF